MMSKIKKILLCFIVQFHCLFDCFIDFIFGIYYDGKEVKIPPVSNPIVLESAVELAEKIR